jgi:hypothetical protein
MTHITQTTLQNAAKAPIISDDQATQLWQWLQQSENQQAYQAGSLNSANNSSKFDLSHVLYYLGGLLAISAMSWFMSLSYASFGRAGLFFMALLYGGIGLHFANRFERTGFRKPSGIMAAFTITMVPLAIFGLQRWLGFWADSSYGNEYRDYHALIDWRWLFMELGTLAIGLIMLRRYRYSFLVAPIAVTLWYMGMDIIPFLLGDHAGWFDGGWELRRTLTLCYGVAMLALAFWVDLRNRSQEDYAFWLYLFGLLTFWGALSSYHSGSLVGKLLYVAINVGLLLIGTLLVRRVFAVFGGVGILLGIGSIFYTFFKDEMLFSIVMTLMGFGIIWLGIFWQKHQHRIGLKLMAWLPSDLQSLLQHRHQQQ